MPHLVAKGKEGRTVATGHHALHCLMILVIFCTQSFDVTPDFIRLVNSPFWIVRPLSWAVLFAILGRTLVSSRTRHGLRTFLWHRLVRDWVPLAGVALVVALLVGPMTNGHSLKAYFRDPALWTYFGNLIGFPQFALPGVFEFNTERRTTLGLFWGVPVYAVLVAVVVAASERPAWRRQAIAACAVLALTLAYWASAHGLRPLPDSGFSRVEAIGFPLVALLAGLLGAAWQPPALPRSWRRWLGLGLLAVVVAAGELGSRDWVGLIVVAAAMALWSNLLLLTPGATMRDWNRKLRPWMPVIYCAWLVSFPVQQLVVTFGPQGYGAWRNLLIAAPVSLVAGVGVWRILAEVVARSGGAALIGPARLPLGTLAEQMSSRGWWLEQLRTLAMVVALAALLALIAAAVLAVALLAFRPDQIGV